MLFGSSSAKAGAMLSGDHGLKPVAIYKEDSPWQFIKRNVNLDSIAVSVSPLLRAGFGNWVECYALTACGLRQAEEPTR